MHRVSSEQKRMGCAEMLPTDALERIFSRLALIDIAVCRSVCKRWNQILSSPYFSRQYSIGAQENWVAVIPEYGRAPNTNEDHREGASAEESNRHTFISIYDARLNKWFNLGLTYLPYELPVAVAASGGILCVAGRLDSTDSICLCNPWTKTYRILPVLPGPLSRPVTVMTGGPEIESLRILVISDELLALYSSGENLWKCAFSSEMQGRPRSPIMASNGIVYGLADVGSPWRPSWRFVCCRMDEFGIGPLWKRVGRDEWGDIFDILKRPRLLKGRGDCLLVAGGLRSSASLNSSCSTFVILGLDLSGLEWDEAGRMPVEFFEHFDGGRGFKIFGGREGVYFSGWKVGKLALWDFSDGGKGCWQWVDENCAGRSNALCRGFHFDPRLVVVPQVGGS